MEVMSSENATTPIKQISWRSWRGSTLFYSTYAIGLICFAVFVSIYSLRHSPEIISDDNLLVERSTGNPLKASIPLQYVPLSHFWMSSLSSLEEVSMDVSSSKGVHEMRFDITGAEFDPQRNATTLSLSLGQSLIITPHLSALFDENKKLVAVNVAQSVDEKTWKEKLAKDTANIIKDIIYTDNTLVNVNNNQDEEKKINMQKTKEQVKQAIKKASRRLGAVYKKAPYYSNYGPTYMRPPGFYGNYPYRYPTVYPRPVVNPLIVGTPSYTTSSVILTQPQIAQIAPTYAPTYQPTYQPTTNVIAPQPQSGITPGDLDMISELLKASNKEMREDILDLTFEEKNEKRKPATVIDSDSYISLAALDTLTQAINGDKKQPQNNQANKYTNGFDDGYKDGYGDGVNTGEKITSSLWCSIDTDHPLCNALPR